MADTEIQIATVPFRFDGLPFYTREQQLLWNWHVRWFPSVSDWRKWLADVFGQLIETPAGEEVQLVETHCLETQRKPVTHTVHTAQATIDRASDNDVALSGQAVAKQHARFFIKEGDLFIEDLGSTLGTYVGNRKLPPNEPFPLASGDQFTIFPYSFAVHAQRNWKPESQVEVRATSPLPGTWMEFASNALATTAFFALPVHPASEAAFIKTSQGFLVELIQGLLRPMPIETVSLPGDRDLLEFVLLAALERANRDVPFPFLVELGRMGQLPQLAAGDPGIRLAFSIRLSAGGGAGITGGFELFLPYRLLAAMEAMAPAKPSNPPAGISWTLPVVAGSVELSTAELAQLEFGDILLFQPDAELLLPGYPQKGWKGAIEPDNFSRLTINNYFERKLAMPRDSPAQTDQPRTAPDLSQLPVRLHVLLAELELTIAQLGELNTGVILDLERGKSEPVRLAVNGKVVGEGELVDVEGHLGVKVTGWKE